MSEYGSRILRGIGLALALGAVAGGCRKSEPMRPVTSGLQISGVIEETTNAPPYTYLRVRTDNGTVWAAVPVATVRVGATIRIANGVALKNFDAPGLSRKLDSVIFGVVQR